MKREGVTGGAYANARIARRSTSRASKIHDGGRDGEGTEGRRDNSRGKNRVDRSAKVFPSRGVGRAQIFSRPFEVSRSNSRVTNRAANVGRKTGPTLRRRLHTLSRAVPPFERLNVGELAFAKVKRR